MSKARSLADTVSTGGVLEDSVVSVSEVSGAAPIASPTFTGTVTADGLTVDGHIVQTGGDELQNGGTLRLNADYDASGSGNMEFKTKNIKRQQIDNNGDISFYEDTGTTAKFFWDASAESLALGGWSSPDTALHLYSANTAITPLIKLMANVSTNDGTEGASIDFVASGDKTAVGSRIVGTRAAAGANMDLRFHTGRDTERMRIDSSGNVGIGTSSPSAPLEVSASGASIVQITSGTNTSQSALYFADPDDTNAGYVLYDHTSNYMSFRTNGSGEDMRIDSSGDVNIANELTATSYNETYVSLSGITPTVNCESGNVFALSTSGNTTFTFSNPPASGTAYGFMLKLTAGGTHTITYPASVDWAGATAPDAPASGETDVLVFTTVDGGTTWYGALAIDAAG